MESPFIQLKTAHSLSGNVFQLETDNAICGMQSHVSFCPRFKGLIVERKITQQVVLKIVRCMCQETWQFNQNDLGMWEERYNLPFYDLISDINSSIPYCNQQLCYHFVSETSSSMTSNVDQCHTFLSLEP